MTIEPSLAILVSRRDQQIELPFGRTDAARIEAATPLLAEIALNGVQLTSNLGAIRMPDTVSRIDRMHEGALALPWQITLPDDTTAKLYRRSFGDRQDTPNTIRYQCAVARYVDFPQALTDPREDEFTAIADLIAAAGQEFSKGNLTFETAKPSAGILRRLFSHKPRR